jgi:hypothetical protein
MEALRFTDKYKNTCAYSPAAVYSFGTKVATIDHETRTVQVIDYWTNHPTINAPSRTTTKHVNHVAQLLGYKVVKY